MDFAATDHHRKLLRERAVTIHVPEDVIAMLDGYHAIQPKLRKGKHVLINRMFDQLERIAALLAQREETTPAEQQTAAGALHYFLDENDWVPELHIGEPGLVDDALVVAAACEELDGAFRRLGIV